MGPVQGTGRGWAQSNLCPWHPLWLGDMHGVVVRGCLEGKHGGEQGEGRVQAPHLSPKGDNAGQEANDNVGVHAPLVGLVDHNHLVPSQQEVLGARRGVRPQPAMSGAHGISKPQQEAASTAGELSPQA